jgi:hypothetical protein
MRPYYPDPLFQGYSLMPIAQDAYRFAILKDQVRGSHSNEQMARFRLRTGIGAEKSLFERLLRLERRADPWMSRSVRAKDARQNLFRVPPTKAGNSGYLSRYVE